jgi:araC-type DNA-binding domain protein
MKFKANIQKNFQSGTRSYQYTGKSSSNPLRYVMDMTGHEIVGGAYRLDREGYYTYLLNYTVSGSASFTYLGRTHELRPGDLVFIDCNLPHHFESGNAGWNFYFLHCNGPALPEFYETFVRCTEYVFSNFRPAAFIKELDAIHALLEKHPEAMECGTKTHPFEDEELFADFSVRIYSLLTDIYLQLRQQKSFFPPSIVKARDFIAEHFAEKISLEDAASAACLSVYHFSHQFRRYTGTTVGAYINGLRMQKAIELLSTTDKKIIDIAVECGFSDIQMLNKLFKTNFSMTPTQYRKSHRPFFSD